MLGDVVRYAVTAGMVLVVGALLGYRPEAGLAGVAGALVLLVACAVGISLVFTAVGLLVRTPGTMMTMSWLVLLPLTFASNVYVDPLTMPPWLQAVVAVNPVALIVTALRGLLAGTPDATAITLALAGPGVVAAIFGPVTMRLYMRER